MRVNPKLRVGLLIGALALTLVAVHWADTLTDVPEASAGAVAEPAPRSAAPAAVAQTAPALDLQKLQRQRALDPDADPFGPRDFRPPPPKVKTPAANAALEQGAAPPPPPQAPPLPFSYMGRLSEDRDTTVFLAIGDRNLVVKPGDVIDNMYKLEEVSDDTLVLTYLPLSQRQTLPIGAH
jgi:hypothetical protein